MDRDVIRRRVTRAAGFGAAGTALGLLPVGRLEGWGRTVFIGGPAALAAGLGVVATRANAERRKTAVVTVAGSAGLAFSQWLWVAGDRSAERWLARRVSHPRVVIAAFNGVATALLNVLGEKADA